MNAAIYARKSTEQRGVSEDAKSVTRQIDHARAFAVSKGWTVRDACAYVDDGVSGAEFEKRAGLQAMLAAAERGTFRVLVVSEQVGGEVVTTAVSLAALRIYLDAHGCDPVCFRCAESRGSIRRTPVRRSSRPRPSRSRP